SPRGGAGAMRMPGKLSRGGMVRAYLLRISHREEASAGTGRSGASAAGDTPVASSGGALVSPRAEGLVVMIESNWASVSPYQRAEWICTRGGAGAESKGRGSASV